MKYIIHYDTSDNEGRNYYLSATNKANYIIDCLSRDGGKVEIISTSTRSSKGKFSSSITNLSNNVTLKKFKAIPYKTFFQKVIGRIYAFWSLLFYLLLNVKKGEKIIVYHSLAYMRQIRIAKLFKRFKLILEVEEIYSDVTNSIRTKKKELNFFKIADTYIFPTILLNKKINTKNKPYCIVHGTYKVNDVIANKFDDGRIHCVYAGTLDPRKGGGYVAVDAGEFLDENYHIHIIGFGSEDEKKKLLDEIEKVSVKTKCIITYDGLFTGNEYIKFIQSCHIGLSTQNSLANFNNTSFPSKILSYLTNGLAVVTAKIRVLETSTINDLINYYENDSPKSIAETIKRIEMKKDESNKLVKLDIEFINELKKMVN